ncbi:bifunctional glutamate N-acetyltransferase/amino-acid acetyltransferase ArgJ [Liquorilactobacillus satsumensis]|uniref:Arginine biosynthesis bifunctional protein ArgJ n=1 Tax=Liquorilactobacillus satsumensis DSM 16230 = JCM 12392 TaxID=1423801 RepID=A0A0R1V1K4_9LACO|nr:bifunctional glutamate N-acetyltransferase/amino-acid acetyltransferase ArgJ [Liquorilactobacillus satsumensis]KRL98996.1 bifunctional ornithine acetyltransferase N-acetylglutamate synthase protein [Liquorilactobacillus satsumensis DSM 16230 = JCM 12392]MCC7666930.1 bifunctional ornithine acetyltransferase/N-acetylglutamate synthase [Liquorilactobacillus satsumensis]MCP9328757.1 bifunctional glutamate N-acetyltransferase/amino-acid acetyltransferase ArgJ [Liquorilactobacillus satsumensis]MCP
MQKIKTFTEQEFSWPHDFYSDGTNCGLRTGRPDLGWIYSKTPAHAAGVYTTNRFCAAPTKLTKQLITQNQLLQCVLMNSVIANSFTGAQGVAAVQAEQQAVATKLGIAPELVGVASTGLIGAYLPLHKITQGITQLELTKKTTVTRAVLTTDTHPKTCCVTIKIAGQPCTITGFAKGSGMIHPKMATMLAFITTDAAIEAATLQSLLSELTTSTFNQITVDGDTSTNDMVVTLANGASKTPLLTPTSPDFANFKAAYHHVLKSLAQQIAADGEGATKLVEANVASAKTAAEAQAVAKAVVGSNLVKAALFGADPNWGRIISTLGATSASFSPDKIDLSLNGHLLIQQSQPLSFDKELVSQSLQKDKVYINLELHAGQASGQAWGCDLTYDYVKINASYSS